MFEFAANEESE